MASKAKQSANRPSGSSTGKSNGASSSHGARGKHAEGSGKADPRKAIEKLVDTGKTKGFLTYDEVNDALPADVSPDQLDDVVGALGDEDIEIVDGATQVKIAPKRIADEEAVEKKLAVA